MTSPGPLIVLPTSNHTHTLILLHGRGSNAERFAFDHSVPGKPGILECRTSSGLTLPQVFPGMKFVFPTAPRRRSTARNRSAMNIWFNNSSFEDPFAREELQVDGLADNFKLISETIRTEAGELSLNKVFLGGISQGCAMALHVLLSFEADLPEADVRFGGFIGMSGWLPFQSTLDEILSPKHLEGDNAEEDMFACDDTSITGKDVGLEISRFIREDIMDLSRGDPALLVYRNTPIFLGHGDQDDVVPISYGKRCLSALESLGLDISWKVYAQQGHWFSVPSTIDDVATFLEKNIIA